MAQDFKEDWKKVVDITYYIAKDQIGRGKQYDVILSRALDSAGEYAVRVFTDF